LLFYNYAYDTNVYEYYQIGTFKYLMQCFLYTYSLSTVTQYFFRDIIITASTY